MSAPRERPIGVTRLIIVLLLVCFGFCGDEPNTKCMDARKNFRAHAFRVMREKSCDGYIDARKEWAKLVKHCGRPTQDEINRYSKIERDRPCW